MARKPDSDDGGTGVPTSNDSADADTDDDHTRRKDLLTGGNGGRTEEQEPATDGAGDSAPSAADEAGSPSAASDDERSLPIDRRDYMRVLGGTAAAAVGIGALTGSGAAAEYETVRVDAGDSYTADLGNGDTLENVLIDVTADNADVQISASGSDWTIRNVGIKGAIDVGDESPGGDSSEHEGGFSQVFDTQVTNGGGSALMENIYVGEGIVAGVDKTCMNVSTSHEGHMTVRNVNVGGFSTTCFYISGFGRENTGGTMTIEDSYFENSSSAHIRPAGDVTIRNCTITNTNEVVYLPRTFGGLEQAITARGIWTSYNGSTTRVENCDIDIRESNTCNPPWSYSGPCQANAVWASDASVNLVDCEVRGSVGGNVSQSGTGSNPDTSLPSGCPASAEAAAGGSGNPNGGQGNSTIRISGGSPSGAVDYFFEVSDGVELGYDANSEEDVVEGAVATGVVAGGTDSYRYTGDVKDFSASDTVTVNVDGRPTDPNTLASDGSYLDDSDGSGEDGDDSDGDDSDDGDSEQPELTNTISVSGGGLFDLLEYSLSVTEAVEHAGSANEEDSISGTTASGGVAGGTDAYVFAGDVSSFEADGDVTVTVNGETVDPSELGSDGSDGGDAEPPELTRTLSISGGSLFDLLNYSVSVSEAVDHAGSANEEDSISGTTASGGVAGGTDDYVFAGEVTSFEADGNVTLTIDGETVDPASIGSGDSDDEEQPILINTISISGGSPSGVVDYSVTASEAIGHAGSANPEDSISGRTASGAVAGGTDQYDYAGGIASFEADGDVTVTVNGADVDPSTL